jgi:hypothetical protein
MVLWRLKSMRVKTFVILVLIIPAVMLVGLYVREWFQVDVCLDSGGSFNYTAKTCDLAVSHPYIPFLARHRAFTILVFLSACPALLAAWLGRSQSSGGK